MSNLTPKIIRASAGTGKTFALSNRFISLLALGESPEKILATTFTRKAAGEIYERVITRLAEAGVSEDAASELADFIENKGFNSQNAKDILKNFVENQHRLSICTLDSLFFKIAACFSFEMGLLPNWSISDTLENIRITEESVSRLCSESDREQLLVLMQLLQSGVYKRSIYKQIIAEARDLLEVYRTSSWSAWSWFPDVVKLDEKKIDKLAEELLLAEIPKTKEGKPKASFEKAIIQAHDAISTRDWLSFLDKGIADKLVSGQETYYRDQISDELRDIFAPLIEHAKAVQIEKLKMRTEATFALLDQFNKNYSEQRTSSLSFSDVKHKLYHGSVADNLDTLYYRLDTKFSHLLLDEFQDTSFSEWRVILPVVEEIVSKAGEEHSFFCVGDVKQAIYGWRGGVAEIFDSLENRWPHLDVETTEKSYRCSQTVIDTVNKVFSNLVKTPLNESVPEAVGIWSGRFREHETAKKNLAGEVELVLTEDVFDDAARKVKEVYLANPNLTIGVLCRKNRSVAEMIYRLLSDDIRVPASEEGGNPLTDSLYVNIILAVLKFIEHPSDSASFFLLKNTPLSSLLSLNDENSAHKLRKDLTAKGLGDYVHYLVEQLKDYADERDKHRLKQLSERAYAFELKSFNRLSEFVQFVENEKVEDPSSQNVRVMTVHQAKGLEFDVVILPELDDLLYRNITTKIVSYHSDPVQEPEIVSRFVSDKLARLDENLQLMKDQNKNERMKEALSVLYVALTRAVHGLYMYAELPPKLDRLPQSYAGILVSTLAEGLDEVPEDGIVYKSGKSDFYKTSKKSKVIKVEPRKPLVLKDSGSKRRKGLLKETASSKEGGDTFKLSDILNQQNSYAKQRGSALHLFLSKISFIEEGLPSRKSLEEGFKIKFQALNFEEIYAEFLEMLKKDNLKTLLSGDGEVYREWAFAYRDEDAVVPGVIDRFVVRGDEVEVVDFKTDLIGSDKDLEDKISFYKPQLEVYKEAVKRFTGSSKIKLKIAFTTHDKICLLN